jgi:N-acetylglutamate synthase-like GNAT family acetyltransferase
MQSDKTQVRTATADDLDAINAIIERAVDTWELPERVKRLAMPAYRYGPDDLDALTMVVAEAPGGRLLGVAAWEQASDKDAPPQRRALLLHGLYVDPAQHGYGTGTRLLAEAELAAQRQQMDGVLVKAQRDAEGFFLVRGYHRLAAQDAGRDYPSRLWKPVSD